MGAQSSWGSPGLRPPSAPTLEARFCDSTTGSSLCSWKIPAHPPPVQSLVHLYSPLHRLFLEHSLREAASLSLCALLPGSPRGFGLSRETGRVPWTHCPHPPPRVLRPFPGSSLYCKAEHPPEACLALGPLSSFEAAPSESFSSRPPPSLEGSSAWSSSSLQA